MAKLGTAPITATDLKEFTHTDSDFAFEMMVLNWFQNNGFGCQHSATYRDPITGKLRQFDIRAEITSDIHTLALAVECKNLRPNFPLLISTMPRTDAEAFHSVILFHRGTANSFEVKTVDRIGMYRPTCPVGKTTDQIGREDHSRELVSNDEQTFDKISQAINGCRDLVARFSNEVSDVQRRIIVPVLVVPSGTLWQVSYDATGAIAIPPTQVQHSNVFLDSSWDAKSPYGDELSYRISHLEIVAFDGLNDAVNAWLSPRGFFS
jgi:hypothetical protein